jgi:hypothetical protein
VRPISGDYPDCAFAPSGFVFSILPDSFGQTAWSSSSKLLKMRSFASPFGGGWLHPSGQQFFIRHLRVCVFIYACGYVYMRLVDMGKYKGGLL